MACIKKPLIKHNWLWIVLTAFIVLITNVTEVYWKQKLPSAIYGNWIVLKILLNLICSCCKSVNYWNLWVLLTSFFFSSRQRKKGVRLPCLCQKVPLEAWWKQYPQSLWPAIHLEAGNVTDREQELVVSICWETSNNTELYLENTHIYFSLLGPKLFSNLKLCILTGTQ